MDSKLILPVEGHQLAEFIYSLLGQRRTIEKIFRNASELVTTKCSIYFKSGRAITVFDQQSFVTLNDLSNELTIGADLRLTYLVRFSGANTPEKQDVRIELFSDYHPRNFPGLRRGRGEPLLKFTIETTNLTWGEDISNHLNTALSHLLMEDVFSQIGNFVWKYTEAPFVALIGLLLSSLLILSWAASGVFDQTTIDLKKRLSELTNDSGLSLIDKKLDLLLQRNYPEPLSTVFYNVAHSPRAYGLLASIALVVCSIWLFRRFGQIRIVACNRHTAAQLEALSKDARQHKMGGRGCAICRSCCRCICSPLRCAVVWNITFVRSPCHTHPSR
jgi:hypothetical protein